MARISTKENKNIYHKTRESLNLTREAAADLMESISPERIEKIENERSLPHPDEVLLMADKYKQPSLCNHYCANHHRTDNHRSGHLCCPGCFCAGYSGITNVSRETFGALLFRLISCFT